MATLGVIFKPHTSPDWIREKLNLLGLSEDTNTDGPVFSNSFILATRESLNVAIVEVEEEHKYRIARSILELSPQVVRVKFF